MSNLRLKIIGSVLVLFSCVGSVVLPSDNVLSAKDIDMVSLTIAVICEAISWVAAPIYAWLLVEGYRHTGNRWAYAGRLLLLALVSEVPYDLVTTGKAVDWSSQNPVFALVITLVALSLIDAFRNSGTIVRRSLVVLVLLMGVAWMVLGHVGLRQQIMNEGALILLAAVIFFMFPRHENTVMMGVGAIGALFCLTPAFGVAVLHYRNGELGYAKPDKPWLQWVFYALYPLMLLVFALV
ncbi:TraX family protein [Bifidobacterium sp.]|uniref:TraX family protein n=1 Tax=Bifidobacterium sp. TaxID=41200 RepID=UPI0025C58725|nr:TraX family protein [Bifidobacterium sp.]MCH4209545.1 conjugal transfer protein TraX [Bifidobacterium sp.]